MMQTTRRQALARLRPPPNLNLADWMESAIHLPPDVADLPGKIRLYPFQRGIAEAISDPAIERVTVLKSARVGYSTLLIGMLGNFVGNDPAPIIAVVPTDDDARTLVTGMVEPIFSESPTLAGLLTENEPGRAKRNTMMSRRFPGGSLKVVSAKAPRNLRAHNARVLIVDEADACEAGAEGSPILLAEKRTLTFKSRKIVIGSTPIYSDTSNVIKSYAQSDKRIFEARCPHCSEFSEVRWGDIRWPDGRPSEAYWCCPANGCVVEEDHKTGMVAAGRWRATATDVNGHAGFRLNSLISPIEHAAWGKLAVEFLAAKDDPALLQVFTNTVLGEGWNGEGEELDAGDLQARAEPFGVEVLPEEVLAITAGVDVQRDRVEITFMGWDRHGNAYVLGHVVVYGDPLDVETMRQLDEQLRTRFRHPYGGTLGVEASAIDAGDGYSMETVIRFAAGRARQRVYAIKGDDGNRPWIVKSKTQTKGGWLWIVGVDGLKTHLTQRLGRAGSIRFSDGLPPEWFEQLTSERRVVRMSKGQPVSRYERITGRRAEALDCVVYAFAVRQLVVVNWDAREEQLRQPDVVVAPKLRPRVVQSAWMQQMMAR